jgi:CPA1 family monovalent cation:H+ antiporter
VTAADAEILVGVLAAVAVLAQLAAWLGAPYPVVLVLGGLMLGLVPGLRAPQLDPGVFFFIFLPPLLYSEAFLYSSEAFRAAATEIVMLAVGLVAATAVAVAVVAHAAAGLSWPSAFVLGAVVGPTDPVAATAVIRRIGVAERIAAVLEGESLVNDGTALVIYKLALGAAGTASVMAGHALEEFVRLSLGGVLIGAAVAGLAGWARRWVTLPEVVVTVSLLLPFAAYLPAERLGVSGVLAAVTAGLLIGRHSHRTAAGTRLRRNAFWEMLAFLLESSLFLLIGLTFREILGELRRIDAAELIEQAALVTATVIGLRFAAALVLPMGRAERMVIGWSGMRGGVSLAAALAVPVTVAGRPQIVLFSYLVVLATLVVPGLTLGPVIGRLGLAGDATGAARARSHVLSAALEHIEELAEQGELPEEIADRLRQLYVTRLDSGALAKDGLDDDRSPAALSARRGAVAAQRAVLDELEQSHRVAPAVARAIERELEAEEAACSPA